jgi:sodium transport system ATP-binding protein
VIRAEGLRKLFGAVVAVDGVSFCASDGTVTGLLGPNGAGKTTSLRMICGLMKPDGGAVSIDGHDMASQPQAGQGVLGVLPDQSGLYARFTAREHIRYFGKLHGLSGADLERRIEKWIDLLDLKSIADRRAAGYSHGERTKVALARALLHDPQNVLLDEPTNGLDVMSTRTVRQVIRQLKDEGRCILLSSHVMQEVAALCDRILIMASGRIVAQGSSEELLAHTGMKTLEDSFVSLVGFEEMEANGLVA